jgi:hypothetical protein
MPFNEKVNSLLHVRQRTISMRKGRIFFTVYLITKKYIIPITTKSYYLKYAGSCGLIWLEIPEAIYRGESK